MLCFLCLLDFESGVESHLHYSLFFVALRLLMRLSPFPGIPEIRMRPILNFCPFVVEC